MGIVGIVGIVGIGGDEIGDADTALLEADEELAPVDPGLGEGAGDTEDDAPAVIPPYSNGNEGGAVAHITGDTDFVVGGVKEEQGDLGKKAGAPFFELLIEGGAKIRHPGGEDLKAAEFSHDLGDTAGAPPESTSRRCPP